jgi:hypothetical protein
MLWHVRELRKGRPFKKIRVVSVVLGQIYQTLGFADAEENILAMKSAAVAVRRCICTKFAS